MREERTSEFGDEPQTRESKRRRGCPDDPVDCLTVPTGAARFRVHRVVVFLLCGLLHLLNWFHRVSPSVLSIYMAGSFGVNMGAMASLSSMFFYSCAVMQPFAGVLADVFEPGYVIAVSSCGCVIGNLVVGISPSIGIARVGRLLLGLCCGPIYVTAARTLAEWFEPDEFQRVVSGMVAMSGVGVVMGQAPLPLFAERFGWRWVFYGIAMLTTLVMILTILLLRGRPSRFGYSDFHVPPPRAGFFVRCWHALVALGVIARSCDFWLVSAFALLGGGHRQLFTGMWSTSFYVDVGGLSRSIAAQVAWASAAGIILGTPVCAAISDKARSRKWPLIVLASIGLAVTCVYAWVPLPSSIWVMCGMQFCFQVSVGCPLTIVDVWGKEKFPPEMSGACLGLTNLWCYAGSAIWQELSGAIMSMEAQREDADGRPIGYSAEAYRRAMWYIGIGSLAGGIVSAFFSQDSLVLRPPVAGEEEPPASAEDEALKEL